MKKYTLFHFNTGDFKAVERYLNEQAEKGWELETVGLFFARWKRTERKDLRWCVDLADPKQQREDRKEYADFCAEGGWELVTLRGNMYLFKSAPGREPFPVQTDPELERKNYNRYYIRNTILGVVSVLLTAAFYALMVLGMSDNLDYTVQSTKLEWHRHWLAVGVMGTLPLWGVWGLWRVADFVRALICNRNGGIAAPPRGILWANCLVSVLGGLGTALFLVGVLLETVAQAEFLVSSYVLVFMWAATLLFRGFTYEFEVYPGERKVTRNLGLIAAAVFVLLVAGRVSLPVGDWSTNTFNQDRDPEGTLERYALLEELPMVRAEDLGISIPEEKTSYLDLLHEYTPVGERWEVEYTFWEKERYTVRCETYLCPSLRQAKLAEEQMQREIEWWSDPANREELASFLVLAAPPQVDMEPVELDWAESARYGENDSASVLVVRIGTQVTCLTAPGSLDGETLLAVAEQRLGR